MGNNSVFDDLGFGASDLGLAPDPDDLARENQIKLDAQQSEIDAEETKSKTEAESRANKERLAGPGSRSRRTLTGGSGLTSTDSGSARKTLLGS